MDRTFFLKKKKEVINMDVYQMIEDNEVTHFQVQDLYNNLALYGHLSLMDKKSIPLVTCPYCKNRLSPDQYSAIHFRIKDKKTNEFATLSEKKMNKFFKILYYDIISVCPYCYNKIYNKNQHKSIIVIPEVLERSTTIEKA